MKGCLGTAREEFYLGYFCGGTWRGKQHHPEDWASGKNMGTAPYCALGGHAGTATVCASLGKRVQLSGITFILM